LAGAALARLCRSQPSRRLRLARESIRFCGCPHRISNFLTAPDVQRSVLAWYPDDAKDILVSGYALGAEKLARKAAVTPSPKARSSCSASASHSAQTEGTFQMLFNAIYWAGMQ
jgi:hypothetical protein